jgi:hypothetical protein
LTTAPPPVDAGGRASREGFFFSVGLGHSLNRWLVDEIIAGGEELRSADTELGVASKLQLGYTFENNLALHLSSRLGWFTTSDVGSRAIQLAGVTGVGATYFFKPADPSVYLSAEVGLSHWSRLDEYFDVGFGACAAAGYELVAHWSIEQSYCVATAKEEYVDDGRVIAVTGKPFVASFTVNYLFY